MLRNVESIKMLNEETLPRLEKDHESRKEQLREGEAQLNSNPEDAASFFDKVLTEKEIEKDAIKNEVSGLERKFQLIEKKLNNAEVEFTSHKKNVKDYDVQVANTNKQLTSLEKQLE